MLLKTDHLIVKSALQEDITEIKMLLQKASLPFEDIDSHVENFLIAKMSDQVIGAVGLEVYDSLALLRSIVIAEDIRNMGFGQKVYDTIVAFAKQKNIKTIYLLTETAEKFFTKNGFIKIERSSAPEKILNTEEFKTLCASSAIAMMKHI